VYQLLPNSKPFKMAELSLAGLAKRWKHSRDLFATLLTIDLNRDGTDEISFWLSNKRYGHVYSMGKLGLHPFRWPHKRGRLCRKRQRRNAPVKTCGPPLAVMDSDDGQQYLLVGKMKDGRNHFEPGAATWTLGKQDAHQPYEGLYWSMNGLALKGPDPGQVNYLMAATDKSFRALVRGSGMSWRVNGVGTASTLVDFDDDGSAEFVSSSNAWPGESDWIAIENLQNNGRSKRIWRQKSDIVHHLSSGDVDNDGRNEVVAIVLDKVFAIREIESAQ
jgi:hypothetical protein